ncbi:hypothetical protein ACEN9X_02355 [Mucilaginibacter sp. Mucisp86]|uniref:hypothetical protein n=1 Tax=Mucilaginibacter sp. Mucisp86 TaxID=3243060 RepID=UPI0039B604AE
MQVKKTMYLLLLTSIMSSCLSVKGKLSYYQKHMQAMADKYHEKVTFAQNPDSAKVFHETWSRLSKKQIKQMLDEQEREMVLMPDTFMVVTTSTDSLPNGFVATQKIDAKNIYIKNKNKIKYIKDHHIHEPYIHLIEK